MNNLKNWKVVFGTDSDVEDLEALDIFLLVIAHDVLDNQLTRAAQEYLSRGCCHVACFGDKSETVHDCLDDWIASNELSAMTTWHCDETVDELIDYLLVAPQAEGISSLVVLAHKEDFLIRKKISERVTEW